MIKGHKLTFCRKLTALGRQFPCRRLMRLFLLIVGCQLAAVVSADAQIQQGIASYYGRKFHGRRTASGQLHNKDSMVCAHRRYPFGTKLRVFCPATKREVVVTVNDRGPYGRGRVIDLSLRAARELGIVARGLATVIVEPVREYSVPMRPVDTDIEIPEVDFEAIDDYYGEGVPWRDSVVMKPDLPLRRYPVKVKAEK